MVSSIPLAVNTANTKKCLHLKSKPTERRVHLSVSALPGKSVQEVAATCYQNNPDIFVMFCSNQLVIWHTRLLCLCSFVYFCNYNDVQGVAYSLIQLELFKKPPMHS